ncbi:translation initiation factor IF-2-like [Zalophus californianus]|uniref:Translation initiation factor IF-2-like n=1 Tax=Zalophus californianus TaxID=9704 RepID=A0A6P9FBG0_ZALCA|nr:translation initiation factor IF-2-like [Zalophus californianus]
MGHLLWVRRGAGVRDTPDNEAAATLAPCSLRGGARAGGRGAPGRRGRRVLDVGSPALRAPSTALRGRTPAVRTPLPRPLHPDPQPSPPHSLHPDRRPSAHPSRCRRPDPRALIFEPLRPSPPGPWLFPTRAPGAWVSGGPHCSSPTPRLSALCPGCAFLLPPHHPCLRHPPALGTRALRADLHPQPRLAPPRCGPRRVPGHRAGGVGCPAAARLRLRPRGHLAQVASPLWAWPGVWLGPSRPHSRCSSESPRRRSRLQALGLGEVPGGRGVWGGDGGAGLRGACPRLACTRGPSGARSRWHPTLKWDTQLWPWTRVSLPQA